MATQSIQDVANLHGMHVDSDVGHPHLPTDSMVAIRLSDSPSLEATGMLGNETTESQAESSMLSDASSDTSAHDGDLESVDNMDKASRRSSTGSVQLTASEPAPSTASEQGFEQVSQRRSRNGSTTSTLSGQSGHLDWEELDKSEERQERDEASDNSTAFLLARLERENNALAGDPKAGISNARLRSESRPPSIQHIKKLASQPTRQSLRYSMLPAPPPMTELEFWAALVSNYPQTAQRLPTLTTHKIRGGIPPPLRGVTWMSISGARDGFLESEYERLCGESSPFEKLIGKDIGRSYPGVDMFRDPNGEGQKMLGKVLNAFSLWDQEIGYCQGLGFVVGPMLMHMGDKDAFCVLVRLMEHYDLRSCFLPNLSGLHLRIYQFQHLLSQHLPKLTTHLEKLHLEPVYLSQWFLSFFGVTCPLPMLLRIYDVVLTEGASETLMRVALSLMRRNEKKILAASEFEDVMSLLLSRSLWDTYNCDADDLVNDFCSLTNLVTREGLESLEASFKDSHIDDSPAQPASKTGIHSAASGFLGKFWAGSSGAPKAASQNLSITTSSRPVSQLRRTPSKQSMASTLNSIESSESNTSSASTDATSVSRQMSADWIPVKLSSIPGQVVPLNPRNMATSNKDKDLHSQIEDLLTALSNAQRETTRLGDELQKQREEREEDRTFIKTTIQHLRTPELLPTVTEDCNSSTSTIDTVVNTNQEVTEDLPDVHSLGFGGAEAMTTALSTIENYFDRKLSNKRSSITQTKYQLRDDATQWKEAYTQETTRSAGLSQRLSEQERETTLVKDQLREARSRIQESYNNQQRLERTIADHKAKQRKSSFIEPVPETHTSAGSEYSPTTPSSGLRELRLGRPQLRSISTASASPTYLPASDASTPVFNKRMSSLGATSMLLTADHKPLEYEQVLLQLVEIKTAETVARAELEEMKGRFDALRKMMNSGAPSPGLKGGSSPVVQARGGSGGSSGEKSPPLTVDVGKSLKGEKDGKGTPGTGGFFSGWGKRNVS